MGILTVGPNGRYPRLSAAVAAANAHDEIHVEPGIYNDDLVVVDTPLRIVGIGGTPLFRVNVLLEKEQGILTTRHDVTLQNLAFADARSFFGNGAGIWHQNGTLHVENCVFRGNQNGLMIGRNPKVFAVVSKSIFMENGAGCGHTHGIYAGQIDCLHVSACNFTDTIVGHHLKSRARKTTIKGNYFGSTPAGSTSYADDLPNGGIGHIIGNSFIKGRRSSSLKMISYGSEGLSYAVNEFVVAGNIFINHKRPWCIGVANYAVAIKAKLDANAFERVAFPLLGRGRNTVTRIFNDAFAEGPKAFSGSGEIIESLSGSLPEIIP